MAELIIYKGNEQITVTPAEDTCYLYKIGSGDVKGGRIIELNDGSRLNTLAEEIRDDYSRWVYSLNELFLTAQLEFDDLSLFFLTDLSCKRSEFFETYDLICSLLLIRERLQGIKLAKARLIGIDSHFERAFRSIFPTTEIVILEGVEPRVTLRRRFTADIVYLLRLIGVVFINIARNRNHETVKRDYRKLFFSVYPQMFSADGEEKKYGDFVTEADGYAVSIITDGMHQKISLGAYWRLERELESRGYVLIDRFLRVKNVTLGIGWLWKTLCFSINGKQAELRFKGLDVTGIIHVELLYSMSRIVRLCSLMGAFQRFLEVTPMREFVYYPCEYPLGRMISYIANVSSPGIVRTGFQMGIVSQRRLEQFLAPGEGTQSLPYLNHAPIPDRILAEDQNSAEIYRYAGYRNVEIMDKVYRYAYLESIKPEVRSGWALIAPGLHDGATMLEQLRSEIENNPDNTYVVKPHPRADNRYMRQYDGMDNVTISNSPIPELLRTVAQVFVTYSSVGIEANRLGLDVIVIDVPGKVNTSPLLDEICNKKRDEANCRHP
jgi:hypothetical protein